MKNILILTLMAISAIVFSGVAKADDGEWEYVVAPYFLGAGMDGDVIIRGIPAEVDLSFGELFEHLEFGFMGHFEATNNKWVVLGDFFYAGLGAQVPNAVIDVNQFIIDGGIGWKVNENFEFLAGARFNRLDAKLGFRGPLGIEVEGDRDWLDPYVGGRLRVQLSGRVAIWVRGDVGGFGVGSGFAWFLNPSVSVDVSDSFSLAFFYRFHHLDYENEEDGFKYDVTISGPGAGIAFHF